MPDKFDIAAQAWGDMCRIIELINFADGFTPEQVKQITAALAKKTIIDEIKQSEG